MENRSKRKMAMGVLAVAGLAAPSLADFNYANFANTAGLVFNGNATPHNGNITISTPTTNSVGSVFHQDMQNISLGFVTDFRFRVSDLAGIGADGFAFLVQNSAPGGNSGGTGFGANALGGGRGAMGYAQNTVFPGMFNDGISNSLAIEFDLFDNRFAYNDFSSDNHISVQSMGTGVNQASSNASLGHVVAPWNMSQIEEDYDVRVVYSPGLMSIFMKPATQGSFGSALLNVNVNLNSLLNLTPGQQGANQAFVGFTAATAGTLDNAERHEILSWSFQGNVIPTPGAAGLLALGGLTLMRRKR